MKKISSLIWVTFSLAFSINLNANPLADKINDEVFDSLIQTYSKFLNINILSEICQSTNYLNLDYASPKIRIQIENEIKAVAKQRGNKEYDAKEIRELTELEFQAFIDGARYGVFVARNYQTKTNNAYCSTEIRKTIAQSQQKMIAEGGYLLKKRVIPK